MSQSLTVIALAAFCSIGLLSVFGQDPPAVGGPSTYAKYAGTATSGWSYGIYDLSLKAGHIVSHRFINMAELKEKYE